MCYIELKNCCFLHGLFVCKFETLWCCYKHRNLKMHSFVSWKFGILEALKGQLLRNFYGNSSETWKRSDRFRLKPLRCLCILMTVTKRVHRECPRMMLRTELRVKRILQKKAFKQIVLDLCIKCVFLELFDIHIKHTTPSWLGIVICCCCCCLVSKSGNWNLFDLLLCIQCFTINGLKNFDVLRIFFSPFFSLCLSR